MVQSLSWKIFICSVGQKIPAFMQSKHPSSYSQKLATGLYSQSAKGNLIFSHTAYFLQISNHNSVYISYLPIHHETVKIWNCVDNEIFCILLNHVRYKISFKAVVTSNSSKHSRSCVTSSSAKRTKSAIKCNISNISLVIVYLTIYQM
jgi:hypothetical protein